MALQNNQPLNATTWIQRLSKVRPNINRFNNVQTYNYAINPDKLLELKVGQSSYSEGDVWNALPFPGDKVFSDDSVSVVVESCTGTISDAVTSSFTGLICDEWTEIVPENKETTAIAFNYDAPASCAPQSILLAVPPNNNKTWNYETLESIVRETLELAKIRCVDPELLDETCSHLFPGLYIALNFDGDSISTDFSSNTQIEQ